MLTITTVIASGAKFATKLGVIPARPMAGGRPDESRRLFGGQSDVLKMQIATPFQGSR